VGATTEGVTCSFIGRRRRVSRVRSDAAKFIHCMHPLFKATFSFSAKLMSCAVLKSMLAHLNVRWYDHLPDTESWSLLSTCCWADMTGGDTVVFVLSWHHATSTSR
jgi:hypothetical protein